MSANRTQLIEFLADLVYAVWVMERSTVADGSTHEAYEGLAALLYLPERSAGLLTTSDILRRLQQNLGEKP